jgi:phospholipid/cholesterol/gamma-HCH transport system ATP-binding protein
MSAPLEIRGLDLDDRDGAPIVRGFDLALAPGERVVLGGPVEHASGLLRAVMGLERAAAGSVRLHGEELAGLDRPAGEAVLARVGYAPRIGALVSNLPLRDNLLLPLRYHRRLTSAEIPAEAGRAAARFGLAELPVAIPPVVSAMMRRRVTLARATVLDPPLLLVDDPTSELDPGAADEIVDRLAAAVRELGAAVLAASNDFRVATALRARTLLLSSPVAP